MCIWQEEVFGPVLPIISFENEEEAIQLANDNQYGLGAVIYSKDIDRARYIASKIEAGCIDINNGSHWQPCTPFGGYKASGMGREHGRHGFQELCQIKVIAEG
jgi:acyl-CoA reductase-like NAD-dependent aldehyde dehydrogenase